MRTPASLMIQAFDAAPSVTMPQEIDKPGLVGAALTRQLARKYVGQQGNGLDIDPFPTQVGSGDDAYALARGNLAFFRSTLRAVTTRPGRTGVGGKTWSRGATPRVTCT